MELTVLDIIKTINVNGLDKVITIMTLSSCDVMLDNKKVKVSELTDDYIVDLLKNDNKALLYSSINKGEPNTVSAIEISEKLAGCRYRCNKVKVQCKFNRDLGNHVEYIVK